MPPSGDGAAVSQRLREPTAIEVRHGPSASAGVLVTWIVRMGPPATSWRNKLPDSYEYHQSAPRSPRSSPDSGFPLPGAQISEKNGLTLIPVCPASLIQMLPPRGMISGLEARELPSTSRPSRLAVVASIR